MTNRPRAGVAAVVITLVAALALTLVAPVRAQTGAKVYRIGWLSAAAHPMLEPFREGLRDLGYVEGRNLVIEQRYAHGKTDRLAPLADELIGLPVDVLMVSGRLAVQAVRARSVQIPIVFVTGGPRSSSCCSLPCSRRSAGGWSRRPRATGSPWSMSTVTA